MAHISGESVNHDIKTHTEIASLLVECQKNMKTSKINLPERPKNSDCIMPNWNRFFLLLLSCDDTTFSLLPISYFYKPPTTSLLFVVFSCYIFCSIFLIHYLSLCLLPPLYPQTKHSVAFCIHTATSICSQYTPPSPTGESTVVISFSPSTTITNNATSKLPHYT